LDFWDSYSNKDLPRYTLANLEQDQNTSEGKFEAEKIHINKVIDFSKYKNVLDLGGGVGIWAEFFIESCDKVTLVEKQLKFIEIAKSSINSDKINYINCDVQNFESEEQFDLIFLSGVSIYLSDNDFQKLLLKIDRIIAPNGLFVIRDAYGIDQAFVVNKISEELKLPYKATYRTLYQYYSMIKSNTKLTKKYSKDMYFQANHFNKRKETRLRLMIFR
jgi:ubiquinone/menaquinone biosynthesis C-methylase UbiE